MLIAAVFVSIGMGALVLSFADPAIFRPTPTDDVLYNPHMGFQTFQHFNGDPLFDGQKWTEVGPEEFAAPPESLENPNHPYTTVAYCRWYWERIEPEEGQFRWDIIDGALKAARERGQTLAIRVMCHDSVGKHDVPKWFQECGAAGGITKAAKGAKYWLPDYSDPLYIKYWARLNAELAARYDGHPDLETVDCASIGPWGEWDVRPGNPSMQAKAALIDCYTDNFHKTPLLMQFDDAESLSYGVKHGTGWRADCLGDCGFKWGSGGGNWCHMYDCYPEGIIYGKAVDAWKTAPVVFEVCGVMGKWHDLGFDADYIFDQAVKWHFSQFNTKSSAVPDDYRPAVDRCLKRMGYRFVLRKLACPPVVRRAAMMQFYTWWENRGCAPIYYRYDLALQFKSGDRAFVVRTDADITRWLPGDVVYDSAVFVPGDLPFGKYALRVGLLHRISGEPKIQLAQEGRGDDGWYDLGEIEIVANDTETARYAEPGTP